MRKAMNIEDIVSKLKVMKLSAMMLKDPEVEQRMEK